MKESASESAKCACAVLRGTLAELGIISERNDSSDSPASGPDLRSDPDPLITAGRTNRIQHSTIHPGIDVMDSTSEDVGCVTAEYIAKFSFHSITLNRPHGFIDILQARYYRSPPE